MKKQIIAILLLLCVIISFSACTDNVSPPKNTTTSTTANGNGGGGEPDGDTPFTVTVMTGGSVYNPEPVANDSEALKVRFTDGKNYYTVNVEQNGIASITGLDGDYTVTLLNLPDGYTYNPNIYKISNDNRNIIVELIKITKTYESGGMGTELYKCINVNKTGLYRANIKKDGQIVYYQFTPTKAGRYAIESIVDISAEMYNPLVDIYNGTSAYKLFIERRDGGGVSGSYTKNFKNIIEIDEAFLGNCYTFGVLVEGKDAVYPTYVDFSITYLGSYEYDWTYSDLMFPEAIPNFLTAKGDFDQASYDEWLAGYYEYLSGNLDIYGSSSYVDAAIRIDGKRVFDEDYYKFNEEDGYYHVFDEVRYERYGGWGPILYADITNPTIFIENPFSTIEYAGNKVLTVCDGTENYKLFIEGYDELTKPHGDSGPYLCNTNCPCYIEYTNGVPGNNGGSCAIEDNCTDCNSTCRHLPAAKKFQRGYADIVNEDGRAPVTKELKIFLQKYSESQRLFSDGNGWVEVHVPRYDAYEDSQWLFACGYYQ